ncbi:MAG TPA: LuxR C-terminal-related transcriptional regulator, partial [Phototrophicaceae bacterium]|nr:LuxR C-terminal-related transcriptional regulator [Phototrophicaceae bacterium]
FIVPLDNERRWYRYHHLFADLLQQRLRQSTASVTEEGNTVAELHLRASIWFENNGLELEAFHHSAAANDIERTEYLIQGKGMPLQFRGALSPILNWLGSLPKAVLDARPSLWVTYASVLSMSGKTISSEQKLQAGEAALEGVILDEYTRNLIGHIAAIRAVLALSQHDVTTIIDQSRRALEYLHPDNLPVRTATVWKLGYAYQLQGDRVAAIHAYSEAVSTARESGNLIIAVSAAIGLGNIQESENQLYQAAETYRDALKLAGDPSLPIICEAYLGLARIFYQWNDLDAAQQYLQQSAQLSRQLQNTDRFAAAEIFLARLKLARGDVNDAVAILAEVSQFVRQHNFVRQIPEIASVQVLTLLRQGNLLVAAQLAETHELPISQVRVYLAHGDTSAALAILESLRQAMETKNWADERLKIMILRAVSLQAHGERDRAMKLLGDALTLAAPGGFARIFIDEGLPMVQLLSEAVVRGIMPDYAGRLLAIFENEGQIQVSESKSDLTTDQPFTEPLSQRELEVLHLIAQGLSNQEIGERLFLALDTVKGHNRRIYDKLQVQRRTEAVARARELGLL